MGVARPWTEALRRHARAEVARSSVAIEGYDVSPAAAVALEAGEPAGPSDDRRAFERLVAARGWPDRLVVALERAWADRVDRAGYAAETGVSFATASADLRRLVDAGLFVRRGATRDAHYVPADALRAVIGTGRDPAAGR